MHFYIVFIVFVTRVHARFSTFIRVRSKCDFSVSGFLVRFRSTTGRRSCACYPLCLTRKAVRLKIKNAAAVYYNLHSRWRKWRHRPTVFRLFRGVRAARAHSVDDAVFDMPTSLGFYRFFVPPIRVCRTRNVW